MTEPKTSKRKAIANEKRASKAARFELAKKLYAEGWIKARIAEELGVTFDTVCRYLSTDVRTAPDKQEPFQENLQKAITGTRIDARHEEQEALIEIAESQSSPSDKYQAYVAASAIKMLRDNLMNVRGPRTVRELSELDQLIRRNLGLNPKGGSSNGSGLSIDISILNNAKAANGGARVVVEAEEVTDD
jgi:predicted transcriptional regulator